MGTWERIYDVVRRVPEGRVTSYGAVARGAGLPGYARQVGYALAALPEETDVPWQRVVNARGEVSARRGGRSCEILQRTILESEGVAFDHRGRIDMDRLGWEPAPAGTGRDQRAAPPVRNASRTSRK
jgi:methylated-DNA-protein-cysteine methyltransferase-like protein